MLKPFTNEIEKIKFIKSKITVMIINLHSTIDI
jgi:hypothetical protein